MAVIQSNVAQPQIIQRAAPLDTWISRLTGLAQLGAQALQGYHYYAAAQAASKPNWQALQWAVQNLPGTLEDENMLGPYLRSIGVPPQEIHRILASPDRGANFSHEMVVRNHKAQEGRPVDFSDPNTQRAMQYNLGATSPAVSEAPASPLPMPMPGSTQPIKLGAPPIELKDQSPSILTYAPTPDSGSYYYQNADFLKYLRPSGGEFV